MARTPTPRAPMWREPDTDEALQRMQAVAEYTIGIGDQTMLEQAKAAVRRSIGPVDDAIIERRAMAIVKAAQRKVDGERRNHESIVGLDRACQTCRFSSWGTCKHDLSMTKELRNSAQKKCYDGLSEMRSVNGACGPEGVLWSGRTFVQRWFDREDTTWYVIPATILFFFIMLFLVVAIIVGIATGFR